MTASRKLVLNLSCGPAPHEQLLTLEVIALEEVSCTQNDLMQVMQKLLNERKKVKSLEQEVLLLRKDVISSPLSQKIASPETTPQDVSQEVSQNPILEEKEENLPLTHENSKVQLHPLYDLKNSENEQQKEREVQLLKNIIKELAEKLKEAHSKPEPMPPEPAPPAALFEAPIAPLSIPQPVLQPQVTLPHEALDSTTWQLKQNLYQAQNEIRQAKERNATLEEEIRRLQQFKSSIQAELKEQKTKTHEAEIAKQSSSQDILKIQETYKARLSTLEEELHQTKLQLASYAEECKNYQLKITEFAASAQEKSLLITSVQESEKEKELLYALQEHKMKIERLEIELEDQKLLFYEVSAKHKDLDLKNASITAEKLVATMQLQETTKELTQKDILYKAIIREKEQLLHNCTQIEEKLEEQKSLLFKGEEEIKRIHAQNEAANLKIGQLEKRCEELGIKDALIEEKEHRIAQMIQEITQLEAESKDHKNQIELLEQHLTRKVKECAQFAHSAEEMENSLIALRAESQEKNEKIEELSHELMLLAGRENELLEQGARTQEELETRLAMQNELVHDQEQKIASLKKIEEKYLLLEQLLGRISNTISSTDETPKAALQNSSFSTEAYGTLQKPIQTPAMQNNTLLQKPILKEPVQLQHKAFVSQAPSNDLFISSKEKAVRHDFFE